MTSHKDLRRLPSVNAVLDRPTVAELIVQYGRPVVTYAVRTVVDRARARVLNGEQACDMEAIVSEAMDLVAAVCGKSLRPVINATGVALHTNLGRAPLSSSVVNDIAEIARGYSNLEFDLQHARRGHRHTHVAEILKFVTSAEDAVVVNNNAAGIILTLHTLARDREVVISRGELIEIGGSFRIPEIMAASGARMVEVGTTNRTRLSDYEAAIGPETAILFKAHKSNYSITGFTEEVSVRELARLSHAHGLLTVYDVGSGLLRKLEGLPLRDEPDVRSAIADGADLVMFSCDKLLGGPQAGVVAGRSELISRLAEAPLMRAFRVGKLTLAGLSSVCRQYVREESVLASNPALAMLARRQEELERLASRLLDELKQRGISARLVESVGRCGGGSLPNVLFKSVAVEVLPRGGEHDHGLSFAERLFGNLLRRERPVLGVLREGKIFFDVLTVFEDDIPYIAKATSESLEAEEQP